MVTYGGGGTRSHDVVGLVEDIGGPGGCAPKRLHFAWMLVLLLLHLAEGWEKVVKVHSPLQMKVCNCTSWIVLKLWIKILKYIQVFPWPCWWVE